MTLPTSSRVSDVYTTNGSQKDFSFGFRVFYDPENGGYGLEVRRQTKTGYEIIPKSQYDVIPSSDSSSGIIRFYTPPASGMDIYIAGNTATIQQLNLTNYGRYDAESIETQFDYVTAIIQEWLSSLGEETRQRIAADEILNQYVVQRINEFVQQVNQNWDDKSQEIEDYIATIMPSFTQTLRDEIEAFAVAGMQDAIEQTLAESKDEIDDAVARANAAATAAAISGKVYDTPEAGVDPVTGVADGAYFNVRSSNDESYIDEYKNIGGAPTPTGKSYPSYSYINYVASYVAMPAKTGKTYSINERVTLDSGDIVKSLVPSNTNNPNLNMSGWVSVSDATQLMFSPSSSNIKRAIYDSLYDRVNPKDWGAIGDGVYHTVQDWVNSGKFSNLTAIQVAFPNVSSLSECLNWAVFQRVIGLGKVAHTPKGRYVIKKTNHTKHTFSPNRLDTGGGVVGEGAETVFTQLDASVMSDNEDLNNNEAIFSIHGCYNIFKDFAIESSRIGFYLGQDLTKSELSGCYLNVISGIQIKNVGTGILFDSSGGNHYNRIENIHFIQCQIDCRMRNSSRSVSLANNNRNTFTNIRSNRSIVGLWCSAGDTNRIRAWDGEGCGESPTGNNFPTPVGLPTPPNTAQLKTCVHIFDGNGQLNDIQSCKMENCQVELYSNNYANTFMFNGYHENVSNGTQVFMPTEPKVFISAHTFYTDGYKFLSNVNINAFPKHPYAGRPTLQGTRIQLFSPSFEHRGLITENGATRVTESYHLSAIFELGAVPASSAVQLVLWDDVDPSTAATIEVDVSGLSAANTLCFSNKFFVTAYRSSSKALSRYFMKNLVSIRATGQGSGDESTVITGVISHGGATTRQLILTLTVPAYNFESISVYAKRLVTKV